MSIAEMIVSYLHCGKCLKIRPSDVSPAEYQDVCVGVDNNGDIVIACNRHDDEPLIVVPFGQFDDTSCSCC